MLESLDRLSDDMVIARVKECASNERRATADLLVVLGELDARRLYLGQGFSSLFSYCIGHLHFSERAAYSRIEAARLARRFPIVLRLIADASLSLTAVALVSRHLTADNHRAVLAQAAHKTTREVEQVVAALSPQAGRAAVVRRVPASRPVVVAKTSSSSHLLWSAPTGGSAPEAPSHSEKPPSPLLEERYRVHVMISKQAHADLMHARDLLRHVIPNGDIGAVLERAISLLAADLEKRKLARVTRPRECGESGSAAHARTARIDTRHIPAAVRREVWRRDRGRCAFVGAAGRCRERGFLEMHHVVPFAAGGLATPANIELRCRAHNAHEAQVYFGAARAP